ncbi:hypothetical protein [Demequina sediminicola]|uniref:hypothetical protein n=1 Tax=Demequina sediminicola TaxID=1095026 RepID=UPI00078315EE|nr:hypothetical protein [Demequina sediminicola]
MQQSVKPRSHIWADGFRRAAPMFGVLVAALIAVEVLVPSEVVNVFSHVWVWVVLVLYVLVWALVALLKAVSSDS